MMNPFERFYDVEIAVYEQSMGGYNQKGEKTLLGSVVCDVQPYTSDTESRIYGLTENRCYKLYCDKNDFVKNGRCVEFGGAWYMICQTEIWSFGMTAVIRSMENES
ncbi:MAG: hypothetical protein LIO53_02630 [Oscillospiraceae bacterium]|nr:hypothetical protein [Oscillospiraceae bacterium]